MPQLSKNEGISFNGFSVDNKNGFYLTNVVMPAKPEQAYTSQYLPGRDETIYGSGGYKDIQVIVEVGIRYSDLQDRSNKINAIMQAWCFAESKLKLKHNAYFYVGKVLDTVDISEDGFYTILSFPFTCRPFMYSESHEITLNQTTTIEYAGDYKCRPILKFGGLGTHTITCNGDRFRIVGNNKNITVDCQKGIVYYDDFTNAMEQFEGDFIALNPLQNNTITWTGTNGSTAPKIIYQDTSLAKLLYTSTSYVPGGYVPPSPTPTPTPAPTDEATIINVLKNTTISVLATVQKTVIGAINSLKTIVDNTFKDVSFSTTKMIFTRVDNTTKEIELPAGTQGPPGEAATIEIGTVTSGTTASVTNTGTTSNAVLNFILPKGDKGDDGSFDITTEIPTLTTESKTVPGAINEHEEQINDLSDLFATEQVSNYGLSNGWVISYTSSPAQINKIGGKVFACMDIKDGVKTSGTIIYASNIKPTKSFQGQVLDHFTMMPVGRFTMDTTGKITLTSDITTNYIYLKGSEC